MTIKVKNDIYQKILDVEQFLDDKDRVSLAFLVCDDVERFSDPRNMNILKAILEWAKEKNVEHVCERIIEALNLMQNKLVLNKLSNISNFNGKLHSWIKPMRRAIFEVIENMEDDELSLFVDSVYKDFERVGESFTVYHPDIFELNILFWLKIKYISDSDVTKLVYHLSAIGKSVEAEMLRTVMVNLSHGTQLQCDNDVDLPVADMHEISVHHLCSSSDRYEMNIKNMGVCLIISQKSFNPEAIRQRKLKFEAIREGTDNDRDILKIVFTALCYRVLIKENLDNTQFEEEIKTVLQNDVLVSDSSFVLCILSHGQKGHVFCVDGLTVEVETIEKWICANPYLRGKPKVLIIQACQGNQPQVAKAIRDSEDDTSLEVDGERECTKVSPRADLVTFWACVPGSTSLRHTKKGSLFIQTLSTLLLKKGHEKHLLDLFTEVSKEVNGLHIHSAVDDECTVTTPIKTDTLTKNVYFPYSADAVKKAAMLLLEKNLFEVILMEYGLWMAYKAEDPRRRKGPELT